MLDAHVFHDDLEATVDRRMRKWVDAEFVGCGGLHLKTVLKEAPPAWAMACLKTWTASWLTRRRMQEQGRCLCGCDEEDTFTHYVHGCMRFQHIVALAANGMLHADPLGRLGLLGTPGRHELRLVVMHFHAYRLLLHREEMHALTVQEAQNLAVAVRLATDLPMGGHDNQIQRSESARALT